MERTRGDTLLPKNLNQQLLACIAGHKRTRGALVSYPKVAGSNPAPATNEKSQANGLGFSRPAHGPLFGRPGFWSESSIHTGERKPHIMPVMGGRSGSNPFVAYRM